MNDSSKQLPLLTEAERHKLLVEWNNTATDYPRDKCIHELFEEQVERTPDAVAVVFEDKHLTYRGLNSKANQLAHYLRKHGVGPEVLVGICTDRSLEMVIGILGILKAGGAYVPLDPAYPRERLAFMLEDAAAPVILTQRRLLDGLPRHRGSTIYLDTQWEEIARHSQDKPVNETTSTNLAYVIYTSGSTGKPKGVMNTHQGICNRILWMQDQYRLTSADAVLQKTPFSFDVSVWEFFWPLLTGARLIMARPGGHQDPAYLVSIIMKQRITIIHFVPSMLRYFLEESGIENCSSLRHVMCSGEALAWDLQERFFSRMNSQLHNLYGPTEAAVDVTHWTCVRNSTDLRIVPIGRPVANTETYILDSRLQPVSIGVTGQLYLGGVQVARGYLNRPELTAEKFIQDPFSDKPGARLYKTGDLARYLADGNIEFLGRIDHQVKIRGFRIELGEIEAILGQHPAVRETIAIAREDQPGDKRLVAYVTVHQGSIISTRALRNILKEKLPEYMVPAIFMFLEKMPLTPNGKVDRQALPHPGLARPELHDSFMAPETPDEKMLAKIYSEVLQIHPVGIHDSFFELGGDSIRAIQLLARAHQKGLNITLEQLFHEQTVAKVLRHLDHDNGMTRSKGNVQPFVMVSPEDRQRLPSDIEDAYPMLMLQMGMFYHNDKSPESAVYHDVFSFRIGSAFDQKKFETAIDQFTGRHPAIRTSFDLDNFSEPLQLVHKTVRIPFTLEDLQNLSYDEQTQNLEQFIHTEKHRSFDRTQAPLMRIIVQRYNDLEFQLIFSFHHAILDGWSLAATLTEILQDYFGLIRETGRQVSAPKIHYREYVALERDAIASEDCRRFWAGKLAEPHIPVLPRWPKACRSGGAEQVRSPEVIIPDDVFAGVKGLAQKAGVPLKSVLLTAHYRVMSLLHGETDVISGLVTNGRPEEIDGERMIGLFLNTVPLRIHMPGGAWIDLVRQIFAAECEMLPYRRYPLAEVQRITGAKHLLESAFDFVHFHVYQNLQAYKDTGFMEGYYLEANSFILLTTFMMDVTSTQLKMHMDYQPAELCLNQIEAILGYYVNTLTAMAKVPTGRYESFCPLSTAEYQQTLADWNATRREYPKGKCVHELFEEQVERNPDAVAVIFEDHRLTYQELNSRANQLAHYLKKRGVGPEVLVGICVERSLEMVIGILGILKAGGAYVPLDPAYPKERLAFMLEDAKVPVLLTQQCLITRLPGHGAVVVCLDTEWDVGIARESKENTVSGVKADNLAYVIYTSGSTGNPKGVAIEHHSPVNLVDWAGEIYSPAELSGVLASTSICFDLSVFELFATLCNGGTVILAENALQLASLSAAQRVTLLNTVPSAIKELLRLKAVPPSVRVINLAGEPLSLEIVQQLYQLPGIEKVYDLYGPSETTTYSTFTLRRPDGPCTIGRPIANTQIYLLDSEMQPVPIGVTGELFISGDGLARGYLNRPELTEEKFIPNPFSLEPGALMYRTGDLARYLPDGNIEFLGRIDNQIKIRGFRIELGEIEAVLGMHPAIREAVVSAREDQAGDKRLAAYVVPEQKSIISTSELRGFLKQKLPDYMIPFAFVVLESLPLTPNGKVDRKALPEPDSGRPELDESFIPARTPIEELLAGIWCEVLGLKEVGIHDNFFELGGHSLLATQVMSRLRNTFQADIPLRRLFETPNIAGLAGNTLIQGKTQPALPIVHLSLSEGLPLSFAQQRLWFLDQLQPGSSAYNIFSAFRLTGRLNVTAIEESLGEIIRRHEVLRTTFVTENDQPAQRISPSAAFILSQADLSTMPEEQREARVQQLASEEASCPFDLTVGPLLRATLLRLTPQEHVLLLTVNHIVSDGWSMGIFYRELSALYETFSKGNPSPLPELSIQYADFAIWQRKCLQGEALALQLAYWKKQLNNSPSILALPTDRPRQTIQTYHSASQTFVLSKTLSEGLKTLSQQAGVTLFMTLLAAFKALLYHYTGQDDIVVGTPIANRNRVEIEPLIGFFVNTLVLRTDLSGDPTFKELLSRVREVALEAYANQDLPFEKLVEELHPERDLSHTPLFQVWIVLQNTPSQPLDLLDLAVSPVEIKNETAKFDLTLEMIDREKGLVGTTSYNTDLFDPATIEQLVWHFQTLLEGIMTDSRQRLSQLSLLPLPISERTGRFGQDNFIHPINHFLEFKKEGIEQSISDCFEKQAQRYPYKIAIKTMREEWTYAALNQGAHRVAQTIMTHCGPGAERIALLFEHGAAMLVGLLGVLKAGKTYVPLDPAYPEARLAYILRDSGASVLLTNIKNHALAKELTKGALPLINIDEINGSASVEAINISIPPDTVAYLLYTSGSTGKPKGVMQNHRNVLHHIRNYTNNLHICAEDRLTLLSSYGFDAAVMDIFGALLNGATLYPIDIKEDGFDVLYQQLVEQKITIYHSTPTVYRYFIGSLISGKMLPFTRLVVLGGEEVFKKDVELYKKHFPQSCLFVNGLGPTESTVSLQYFISQDMEIGRTSVPVGYPVEGTEILLLNEAGKEVAIYGEIAIRSPYLALGYWQKTELTEASFLSDPTGGSRRTYRTGDMGRLLPDGKLEFVGRKDFQLKVRGFRIELGEIEVVLAQHPSVGETVVIAREDQFGYKQLVAYVVLNKKPAVTNNELRNFLRQELPDYMIPSAFVSLDALPLTPNGKIDRMALPAPDSERPVAEDSYVAPRNSVEEVLAGIWCEILGLKEVGIHDNFFELGGHSLLATQVMSRLRNAFQIEIPLRTLFESPTVEELAIALLQREGEREKVEQRAALLLKVAELSEDEVNTMLEQRIHERHNSTNE